MVKRPVFYHFTAIFLIVFWVSLTLAIPTQSSFHLPATQSISGIEYLETPDLSVLLPYLAQQSGNEIGATEFLDKSGNENNATCADVKCPTSGRYGKTGAYIQFDGKDDQIEVPHNSSLDFLSGDDFSLELWILPISSTCGYCRLLNKYDGKRGFSLDMGDNQGNTFLTFFLSDGDNSALIRSRNRMLLNEWHHIAAVISRQEGRISLYIDGEEVVYQQQDGLSAVGSLGTSIPLLGGKLTGEAQTFTGMMRNVIITRGSLPAETIRGNFKSEQPATDGWFARWNAQQILTVFEGFGLEVTEVTHFDRAAFGSIPITALEGVRFSNPSACANCTGQLFTFANRADLAAVRHYFEIANRQSLTVPYVYEWFNGLVVLNGDIASDVAQKYKDAFLLGATRSQLDAPTNLEKSDFESWNAYYPTDRGQQRDVETGRSQRTFDRWEGANRWLHGQATWLYQNPQTPDRHPPGFPEAYAGRPLDYYYHYHCEETPNPDPTADCLNWQIYIELLTQGADETELLNWARGGWGQLTPRPPRWEVYYPTTAFGGNCTLNAVQITGSDAYLQNPTSKQGFLFRLPKTPGAWFNGPEICALTFNSYLYRLADVTGADRWRVTTITQAKEYNATLDRNQIQAQNTYYAYLATVNGEDVYRQWAAEIYWTWEMKPSQPLLYGLDSFWWWTWPTPAQDNRDSDTDPAWAALQWCRLDSSQGPEGLGALVCTP
jgi:hypothetical protein